MFISIIATPSMNNSHIFNQKVYSVADEKFKSKIKSANLSTDYEIEQVLKDVDTFGLNTVNVPIIIKIDSLTSSEMSIDEDSFKKGISMIKKLKARDINVILEAYPWIKNGESYETNWKPDDVNKFFDSWKNDILGVLADKVAKPYRVYAMNVASNLVYLENYQDKWCDIIDFIKNKYNGFITYRTCWWYTAKWDKKIYENFNKKLSNKLFSKVDFISVAAYFELTDRMKNTVTQLEKAIYKVEKFKRGQNIKEQLYKLHKKWDKPIFFGELGFPRKEGASIEPWNEFCSRVVDGSEQARCFQAYKNVFEKEPWHLGFSVFAVGEKGINKNYYPSKESEEVIKSWYCEIN